MLIPVIFTILFINIVNGNGEFTVINCPSGTSFKGHERVSEQDLLELYSAALGFSIERSASWSGFYITNPFKLAHAVVEINVDGVSSLDTNLGHQFPLKSNADNDDIFYSLSERINSRYPNGEQKLADINLSEGLAAVQDIDFLSGIKEIEEPNVEYAYLRSSVKEDRSFLQEINLLNAISKEIENGAITSADKPSYFDIKFFGLHTISDLYGENAAATKEAKQLLIDSIIRLNAAFKNVYNDRVLFTIVSSDASHTRRAREVSQTESKAEKEDEYNRAKTYNANYPVIFNIILWFGVVMVFTLLAISMAIGNMDPGRDSIIYRMTSTRMKKDN
ncbi:hypothetical protein RI129_001066 [Pyrocoelia pectoralis]|uniref:Renin receptor n=1 Tax=Pyrocoelia pectoralis TaxID=417401 RepID=A0AAN7VK26_9COLE